MAKRTPEKELRIIEDVVRRNPDGITTLQIANALDDCPPLRTLQYRLKSLIEAGRLIRKSKGRGTKYLLQSSENRRNTISDTVSIEKSDELSVPLSKRSIKILDYLNKPSHSRKPIGYNHDFLNSYRPNVSFYLSLEERTHLNEIGKPNMTPQSAGTYARQILSRLLIDLSWNSSRLEGNTYSLLDTKRLIEFGEENKGLDCLEAQMILNHKDAIEFLVSMADDIGFNRYTILNLHAILANNLLQDEAAAGRLRHITVGIEKSTFHPLEVPQLIEEYFAQVLATTDVIEDPFEQAFFLMAHLPYLQPFDDVNKRVSRLAANIPFIKRNLSPLSFTDVPRATYTNAILGVYELNRIELLKDVFIWAYERSAARYVAIRQSLGEPNPFRLQHRDALFKIVGEIIRNHMNRKTSIAYIASWVQDNITPADRERFMELAENELLSLHEGNYARYKIRPAEFVAWQKVWKQN